MTENRENLTRESTFAFIRGAVTYIFTFALYKLTALFVKMQTVVGGEQSMFKNIPVVATNVISAVALFLIYNSFTLAFSTYERESRMTFIARLEENNRHDISFIEEMRDIFKNGIIHLEAASAVIPMLLTSLFGGFYELSRVFFPDGNQDTGLFPAAIVVPLCIFITYIQKYESRRYWLRLWRENNMQKLDTPWRLILRLAFIFILYPTVYPLAPLLVFVVISLGAIFAELSDALTVLGLILALALIFGLALCIKLLIAMKRRKNFIRNLARLCSNENIKLSQIKNPYKSFIDASADCSFTMEYNDQLFDCIVLPTLSKSTPFIFTSATDGYFRHHFGTKNHFIGFSHRISFFHSGNGNKIVILNPMPKYVYIEDEGVTKELVPWDNVFGFTLHDDISFLGGADRRCLGKYEPKYH